MRVLRAWQADANRLDVLAYCERHPHRLLVHATTGYQLKPLAMMNRTIDRAVVTAAARPLQPPSDIDDYVAFEVAARNGARRHELTVGCTKSCDVQIDDVTVSELHARFTVDRHGNWYLQDASSSTGTHVNDGDPSPTQVLVSGDRVSFGMVDTIFLLPSQAYDLVRRLL